MNEAGFVVLCRLASSFSHHTLMWGEICKNVMGKSVKIKLKLSNHYTCPFKQMTLINFVDFFDPFKL
jgi:hypothetical protein